MGLSKIAAQAEAWYGLKHEVPRRGTKAHKAMVAAYRRKHHARKNPITVGRGKSARRISPENCPIALAGSIVRSRSRTGHGRGKKSVRFGNCDERAAAYAMHFKPRDAGSKFSGIVKRGVDPTADLVTHSVNKRTGKGVNLSFWKRGGVPAAGFNFAGIGRMLGWWPSAK